MNRAYRSIYYPGEVTKSQSQILQYLLSYFNYTLHDNIGDRTCMHDLPVYNFIVNFILTGSRKHFYRNIMSKPIHKLSELLSTENGKFTTCVMALGA